MSPAVTLADVARMAGVSSATASRALSDHPHVAAATRARVFRAARTLEYVVSPEASRLAGGSTGRVAVLVPDLAQWFCGALLNGLAAPLRAAGLDLLLYPIGDAGARREFFDELPARRKVDAVVLAGCAVDDRERDRLERLGVGIVAAGERVASHPSVRIDDHAAARLAVDHLVHLGHRRIGMIAADGAGTRRDAYRAALRDGGLPADDDLVVTAVPGADAGAGAMSALLGRSAPTAVFAHTDELALGAVRTVRRAGLRVPDDVSVIGVDDHPLAALTDLSTVARPAREQGEAAGRMVLACLRDEPFGRSVVLPARLVIRASTAPPRPRRRRAARRREP